MSLTGQLKFWFIIGITALAFSLVVTEAKYDPIINSEVSQMEQVFGSGIASSIYDRSIEIVNACCGDMIQSIKEARETATEDTNAFSMTFITESIVKTMHILTLRALAFVEWMKWTIPFAIFMLIDALVVRKIRSEDLAWQSPLMYHMAMHGLVFSIGAVFAYFLVPMPVIQWVIPFFILSLISSISVAVSNFQRLI